MCVVPTKKEIISAVTVLQKTSMLNLSCSSRCLSVCITSLPIKVLSPSLIFILLVCFEWRAFGMYCNCFNHTYVGLWRVRGLCVHVCVFLVRCESVWHKWRDVWWMMEEKWHCFLSHVHCKDSVLLLQYDIRMRGKSLLMKICDSWSVWNNIMAIASIIDEKKCRRERKRE